MASNSSRRFTIFVVTFVVVLVVALLTAVGMGCIGYFGPLLIPR